MSACQTPSCLSDGDGKGLRRLNFIRTGWALFPIGCPDPAPPLSAESPSKVPLTPPAAATAAKSVQLCSNLCDPIDGSSPGSPVPGILQARTLE